MLHAGTARHWNITLKTGYRMQPSMWTIHTLTVLTHPRHRKTPALNQLLSQSPQVLFVLRLHGEDHLFDPL